MKSELIIAMTAVWLAGGLIWVFLPKGKKNVAFKDPRDLIGWSGGNEALIEELKEEEQGKVEIQKGMEKEKRREGKKMETEQMPARNDAEDVKTQYVNIGSLDAKTILDT